MLDLRFLLAFCLNKLPVLLGGDKENSAKFIYIIMSYHYVFAQQMLELLQNEPVYMWIVRCDASIKMIPVYGFVGKAPF